MRRRQDLRARQCCWSGWLRQRAHEAVLAKARRGELVIGLPVGYVRTSDGHVEKDPDQRIQQAISLVFERFSALGSARQVLLWCRQEGIALPVVKPDGQGAPVVWRLPVYGTILRVLQNPIYAGAYAFGRTGTRTHVEAGVARKSRGHRRRRPEEWIVLLRDHHEAYIARGSTTNATSRCSRTTRICEGRWPRGRCDGARACWPGCCGAGSVAGDCT